MQNPLSRVHHYVPEWYQKRFLAPGTAKLHVLDLNPETVKLPNGKCFTHNAYRMKPTSKCFYSNDLYMLRFGQSITDTVERNVFGAIDRRGSNAIEEFSKITGFSKGFAQAQGDIPPYMGAQRFRTPRGLDWLKEQTRASDHNQTLAIMANSFQQHTTMWAEGIWEIVRARNTKTKFIISDEPVTFYNSRLPPSAVRYPGTEELAHVGTRSLLPLGPDSCLIITHLQFTLNPNQDPKAVRINARRYDQVMMYAGNVQFDRELEEDEVIRINLILKSKASRYIAAGNKEWLYPEKCVRRLGWAILDDDWFLLPNLWKIGFASGVMMGYKNGSSWAADEYGHHPGHPLYKNDRARRDREWKARILAQQKWAKLRRGKSLSRTHETLEDGIHDKMMLEYLDSIAKK
jgi:hypothetical protein